jgi:hypothetical protein
MARDQARAVTPQRFMPSDNTLAAIVLFLLFVILSLFGLAISAETPTFSKAWAKYAANHAAIAPIFTAIGGLGTLVLGIFVAWVGLGQLKTARLRHEEQTRADLQQRITESFTAAVEQLGSEKLQVRIGGIYALERIARESDADYRSVMETLTGFVRARAPLQSGKSVDDHTAPDVATVLAVVGRRGQQNRERERKEGWRLDLSSTNLKRADFAGMHFEGVDLSSAYLEGANFGIAHLNEAYFLNAHLNGAVFLDARLHSAIFFCANLKGADLSHATLNHQTDLEAAHLEGAKLEEAIGLTQPQLDAAHGDAHTSLPIGLTRPAHWTKPKEPTAVGA